MSECQWTQRNINNNDAADWYAYGKFLGDHEPTDVLSFVFERSEQSLEGEVVASADTARSCAAKYKSTPEDELLGYGVPAEWLKDVRQATEDSLLLLADRLPGEAAEALLELATGGKPRVMQPAMIPALLLVKLPVKPGPGLMEPPAAVRPPTCGRAAASR